MYSHLTHRSAYRKTIPRYRLILNVEGTYLLACLGAIRKYIFENGIFKGRNSFRKTRCIYFSFFAYQ